MTKKVQYVISFNVPGSKPRERVGYLGPIENMLPEGCWLPTDKISEAMVFTDYVQAWTIAAIINQAAINHPEDQCDYALVEEMYN